MRTNRRSGIVAQATTIIGALAERWPACFAVYERRRQPLKVGIHDDILAAATDAVTANRIRIALRRYCGSAGYLFALRQGAARIDLTGTTVGAVTADEAAKARKVLTARHRRRAKPAASHQTNNAAPKQLSLADLRAAARARRESAP
jgi:ProP effector